MTKEEFRAKVNELIGRTYDAEDFHCWTLVEELVPGAPKLDVIGGDYENSIREFKKNTPNYIDNFADIIDKVIDGDVIVVGNNYINHAGVIYVESDDILVIHNDIKGVHIEPLYQFSKRYKIIRLLRCINHS